MKSFKYYNEKLILLALASASFAIGSISVLVGLLLIDIGSTFSTSVSTTGQINTLYSIAAVIFAFFTGVLSIKFKHRSLLLAGLLMLAISTVGCFFASDFILFSMFFSLSGAGYAIVNPMVFTLIGEHFPMEKRANAIGWIIAGGALVYVIGAPIIAFMSELNGWRFPLLGFVLPVVIISFLLAFLGLPLTSTNLNALHDERTHLGFKESLNRSAASCLIVDMLRSSAFVAILLYVTSFFRQRFQIATDFASIILLVGAMSYVLGSLSVNLFVNKLGRKSSTVLTALLSGMLTILYALIPQIWISMALVFAASWFFGMLASSANSLTLEQIPQFRGTMMSIDTALLNVGSALGSTLGGLALLYFSYEGLGGVLGAMGIIAAIIVFLFVKDPTHNR